jgi:hypothetical protein
MDYVYLCRDGENEELRYSLRSLHKNAPPGNVWVVGGKPDWYIGNHIPVTQNSSKYSNARKNLSMICQSNKISENIVLMNDDFYFIRKVRDIQYFHGGLLETRVDNYEIMYPSGAYTRLLSSTFNHLADKGIARPLDYELHIPMPMEKDKLRVVLRNRKMLWRSGYGNLFEVGGKEVEDVKVYPEKTRPKSYDWTKNRFPFLSTMDRSFEGGVLAMLKKRFPHKSPYEL